MGPQPRANPDDDGHGERRPTSPSIYRRHRAQQTQILDDFGNQLNLDEPGRTGKQRAAAGGEHSDASSHQEGEILPVTTYSASSQDLEGDEPLKVDDVDETDDGYLSSGLWRSSFTRSSSARTKHVFERNGTKYEEDRPAFARKHDQPTDLGSDSAGLDFSTLENTLFSTERDEALRASQYQQGLTMDMDAVLNPSAHISKLQDLERMIQDKCDVSAVLRLDESGAVSVSMTPEFELDHAFRNIVSAVKAMRSLRFCSDRIVILVEDRSQNDVVRAVDIPIRHIADVCGWEPWQAQEPEQAPSLEEPAVVSMLERFECENLVYGKMGLRLLCSLLRLAVFLYAGSHCSDIPPLRASTMIRADDSIGAKVFLNHRTLGCLHGLVGGPVWSFGRSFNT